MTDLRTRKSNRLANYDYSQAGCYFITFCVQDMHEMLGHVVVGGAPQRVPFVQLSDYGAFVEKRILNIPHVSPQFQLNNYVIMPNHVHLLVTITEIPHDKGDGTRGGASPAKAIVPQIVQSIKSMTTRYFRFKLFQRSYHDHIIRTEEEYQHIWHYINNNPCIWANDCYYIPPQPM